jgi:predicted dehydrogenase
VVGVGQNFRFMPSIKALGELVEAGALGTIMHVEGNYSHDWIAGLSTDHWRSAREESRAGGMTGMGIHVLDCFSHLAGPMRRIAALSTQRALKLPAGDTTAALIEFASGATGLLGTTLKTPFVWRIAVYGENMRAESVSETRLVLHRTAGDPEVRDFPAVNHVGLNLVRSRQRRWAGENSTSTTPASSTRLRRLRRCSVPPSPAGRGRR